MNTQSNPFLGALDRLYALSVEAANHGCVNIDPPDRNGINSFADGLWACVTVERGNTFYVRYVPREAVQWLFDLTQ